MAESRGFAGGAHGHEAVHAAGDLPFDKGHKGVLIDRSIAERGDERRHDAAEERFGHEDLVSGEKQKAVKMTPW